MLLQLELQSWRSESRSVAAASSIRAHDRPGTQIMIMMMEGIEGIRILRRKVLEGKFIRIQVRVKLIMILPVTEGQTAADSGSDSESLSD
jgi:hypothetical protein